MKIRTAVETILSDAETDMSSKLEVVAFLRRYSYSKRPISHYSCRGKATETLKKMLKAMGMEEGTDFKVESSTYDPEFNQIRWVGDFKKVSAMVNGLSQAGYRSAFFDALYVCITNKKSTAEITSRLVDSDGGAVVMPQSEVDQHHMAVQIAKKTESIVKCLAERLRRASCEIENAGIAVSTAMKYLSDNFDLESGKPKTEDAPYILPLSVLEVYARAMCGISGPRGMRANTFMFKTTPAAIDLFRLVRNNEKVMWGACLNAPLSYLWNVNGTLGKNSLRGYFFRSKESVMKARLEDKLGVLIGGNAAIIHDEGADDNVTPSLCVSNHRDFWDYVLRIYRASYGFEAGLSCQCRVGVPIEMKVWNPDSMPSAKEYAEEHIQDWVNRLGIQDEPIPMIAMYAVFLGTAIDHSYSDVYSFLNSDDPFKIVVADNKKAPDFSKDYLTKEETAWEWFAMTHLDEEASGVPQYTRLGCSDSGKPDETEAMHRFKKTMQESTKEYIASKSSCMENTLFSPKVEGYDTPRYTSLSAFVEGTCISLRKAWSPDGMKCLALKPRTDGSRDDKLLVTNVYSGVWTDLSPHVGDEDDDGSVFPCPLEPHSNDIGSACVDPDESRKKFTAFLDRMATGQTDEQVKFAKRSSGTKRHFSVMVETNVDADAFLKAIDKESFVTTIGTVFLQTLVRNWHDPACAFDDRSLRESMALTSARNHDSMMRLGMKFTARLFSGGRVDYRLPSGVYNRSDSKFARNMLITSRQDSFGRLVLIFTMSGDIATYARLAYRFRCSFPLESAYIKEKLFAQSGNGEIVVATDELPKLDASESIIMMHMRNRAGDYDGNGSRSNGDGDAGPLFRVQIGETPPGCAPSRMWFLTNTNMIDCNCVFDTSF